MCTGNARRPTTSAPSSRYSGRRSKSAARRQQHRADSRARFVHEQEEGRDRWPAAVSSSKTASSRVLLRGADTSNHRAGRLQHDGARARASTCPTCTQLQGAAHVMNRWPHGDRERGLRFWRKSARCRSSDGGQPTRRAEHRAHLRQDATRRCAWQGPACGAANTRRPNCSKAIALRRRARAAEPLRAVEVIQLTERATPSPRCHSADAVMRGRRASAPAAPQRPIFSAMSGRARARRHHVSADIVCHPVLDPARPLNIAHHMRVRPGRQDPRTGGSRCRSYVVGARSAPTASWR